jgi:CheY-like chemotaxis protein
MEPTLGQRTSAAADRAIIFSHVALYFIPLAMTPTLPKLRILIADDSELVRQGIISLLLKSSRWEICGEAGDGAEALQKAQKLLPDLVLLDISMPGMSGLDAARMIRESVPATRILIMSQHDIACCPKFSKPERKAASIRAASAPICSRRSIPAAAAHEMAH